MQKCVFYDPILVKKSFQNLMHVSTHDHLSMEKKDERLNNLGHWHMNGEIDMRENQAKKEKIVLLLCILVKCCVWV